jgi:hypothetical protein
MAASKETRRRRTQQAKTEIDGEGRDTRWWVILASNNPDLGSGRYGVWETKPAVTHHDEGYFRISGAEDEPVLFIMQADAMSMSVGQIEHFSAAPTDPNPQGDNNQP